MAKPRNATRSSHEKAVCLVVCQTRDCWQKKKDRPVQICTVCHTKDHLVLWEEGRLVGATNLLYSMVTCIFEPCFTVCRIPSSAIAELLVSFNAKHRIHKCHSVRRKMKASAKNCYVLNFRRNFRRKNFKEFLIFWSEFRGIYKSFLNFCCWLWHF